MQAGRQAGKQASCRQRLKVYFNDLDLTFVAAVEVAKGFLKAGGVWMIEMMFVGPWDATAEVHGPHHSTLAPQPFESVTESELPSQNRKLR